MNIFSALPEQALILLAIGFAAGTLSALLGVGSGILLVPALVIGFGLAQKSAQGISLAVMVPMALVGAIRYMAEPSIEVNPGWVLLLAVGAVAGALLGSSIVIRLPADLLRKIFAVFLLVVAVRMIIARPPQGAPPRPADGASLHERG